MKIGLLGGSFDPIHTSHLKIAINALKQLNLDEVWFIVSKDTPLKERRLNDFNIRYQMVKRVVSYNKKFKVLDIEKNVVGKNFSYDSVKKIIKKYGYNDYYFLIGSDQVNKLNEWYRIDDLRKIVNFAYVSRKQYVEEKNDLIHINCISDNINSTDIRNGDFKFLDKKIANMFFKKLLFNKEFLLKYMSDYRYQHSLRVADLCKEFAINNNLDVNKAYLMGLLHDINKEFKYFDKEKSEIILRQVYPNVFKLSEGIWHGAVGAFIIKHCFKIKDNDIYEAILHHVLGDSKNQYAMLLYCADKLDPNRDYDTKPLIDLVNRNLVLGYKAVVENQKEFYKENYNG